MSEKIKSIVQLKVNDSRYMKILYDSAWRLFDIPEWEMFESRDEVRMNAYATPPKNQDWYNQVCDIHKVFGHDAYMVYTITSGRSILIDFTKSEVTIHFGGSRRAAYDVIEHITTILKESDSHSFEMEVIRDEHYVEKIEMEDIRSLMERLEESVNEAWQEENEN